MVVSTARMSIGAVSKAVGIPVGTLRNWERRYGVPTPERTDGGHRLYGPETIGFLEMVNVAMRHGHRPAQLLRLSAEELSSLVAIDTSKTSRLPEGVHTPPDVLGAIKNFDSEFLFAAFRKEVARRGLAGFVTDYVIPILSDMSMAWENGQMSIQQEHFASEALRDFLSTEWRSISNGSHSLRAVCATFPGEQHFIGLHMAAALMAVEGVHILFLGPDLPIAGTIDAAAAFQADAVVISCSVFSDFEENQMMLKEMCEKLPATTEVWVGGMGVASAIPGVRRFEGLDEFRRFLVGRVAALRRD